MAFTPIALGTLTLSAGIAPQFDRISIPLAPAPEAAWRTRFEKYAFSHPQMLVVAQSSAAKR